MKGISIVVRQASAGWFWSPSWWSRLAGFAVYRLHGIFGSADNASADGGASNEIVPFNPKQVVLEVFGTPGAIATINYLDVHAAPQRVDNAPLPWSLHDHHHRSRSHRQRGRPGQRQHPGLPHHRQRCRQRRTDRQQSDAYTFCLDKSG